MEVRDGAPECFISCSCYRGRGWWYHPVCSCDQAGKNRSGEKGRGGGQSDVRSQVGSGDPYEGGKGEGSFYPDAAGNRKRGAFCITHPNEIIYGTV